LIEIGSKTAEKLCTNKQTDKLTDTTKIMVTWPRTNILTLIDCNGNSHSVAVQLQYLDYNVDENMLLTFSMMYESPL